MKKHGIVHKHPLSTGGFTVVELPKNARFLSVKQQKNEIVAYFLLNPERMTANTKTIKHQFFVTGTGRSFDMLDGMDYLDTLLLYDGDMAVHIFRAHVTTSSPSGKETKTL